MFATPRVLTLSLLLLAPPTLVHAEPPAEGQAAPDFALASLRGKSVKLSAVTEQGPVALIVLRGYPGYQCPVCNRQVQDYLHNAQAFAELGIRVLLVYPGPGEQLGQRASEFVSDKTLPAHFDLLLDPDYRLTNAYDVRWNAPKESAYPSTFLIDAKGMIFFTRISKTHGGRTTAAEVLELFRNKKR